MLISYFMKIYVIAAITILASNGFDIPTPVFDSQGNWLRGFCFSRGNLIPGTFFCEIFFRLKIGQDNC